MVYTVHICNNSINMNNKLINYYLLFKYFLIFINQIYFYNSYKIKYKKVFELFFNTQFS